MPSTIGDQISSFVHDFFVGFENTHVGEGGTICTKPQAVVETCR